MKKQVVLVAARTLRYFINEIPHRFTDLDRVTVYGSVGRVETEKASYRYISSAHGLRGHNGIQFEVWGPYVDWVGEALDEIKAAERE